MTDRTTDDLSAPELSFFANPEIDQIVGLVFTLAMEVSVLATRLRAVEAALGEVVQLDPLDPGAIAEREVLLNRLMANLRSSGTKSRPLAAEQFTKSAKL